jgi:4-hydroxy-4-methyl-2-oxoglutarate aldolase
MNKKTIFAFIIFLGCCLVNGQNVGSSPEYIKALTSEWKGERFPDGRPKVSDSILERLKNISIEEAWGVLRNKGFLNQFEGDWTIINPEAQIHGR